jgi:hypothetical protein
MTGCKVEEDMGSALKEFSFFENRHVSKCKY